MRLASFLVRTAAILTPCELRREWLDEWTAELRFVIDEHGGREALFFAIGSFRDALWLRRTRGFRVESPWACLLLLAVLALSAVSLAFAIPPSGKLKAMLDEDPGWSGLMGAHVIVMAAALIILSAISRFSRVHLPRIRSSPARINRLRRWTFLLSKFALAIPAAFFGSYDVASLLGVPVLQAHGAIIAYVILFRWTLNDQRSRCPVCLRVLKPSASIGEFSHNFLEWYGSELFCAEGHGMLHVPKIATTYDAQRWSDLDSSWRFLFSSVR